MVGFSWQVRFSGLLPHTEVDKLCSAGSTGGMEEAGSWIAYFPGELYAGSNELGQKIHACTSATFEISRLEHSDWAENWKRHFKPLRVSRRFVVRPSWETYRAPRGTKVIIIDPKMAFGTGTHETTRLVMQMMDDKLKPGKRVLDVGTGSGILAIMAAKLGARSVVALDIEQESFDNARENFRLNRVAGKIRMILGSLDALSDAEQKPYDWILANLQRSVIETMLPELVTRLRRFGKIVLSGILAEENEWVQQTLPTHGLSIAQSGRDGEWMAYLVTRTRPT